MKGLQIIRCDAALPDAFAALAEEAAAEGIGNMALLAHDWMSGEMRFEGAGEALFAAMIDGRLAGVGGVSRDPYTPDGSALRMRRLYVRPQSRRCGVGRALAGAMVHHAGAHARLLTVNAAASNAAPLFWDAMGFAVEPQAGRTHALRL